MYGKTVPHHRSTPAPVNREILEAIYKDLRKPETEADMTEVRGGTSRGEMDDVGRNRKENKGIFL